MVVIEAIPFQMFSCAFTFCEIKSFWLPSTYLVCPQYVESLMTHLIQMYFCLDPTPYGCTFVENQPYTDVLLSRPHLI